MFEVEIHCANRRRSAGLRIICQQTSGRDLKTEVASL